MSEKSVSFDKPIIAVTQQQDGKLLTMLARPDESWGPAHFGLVICDVVRHIAKAFSVHEDVVWEWVDKERNKPTTGIEQVGLQ